MRRAWLVLAMAAMMAFVPGPRHDDLDALISKVKPTPQEILWKQIPWVRTVKEAKAEAARTGKPVFVFRVDGDFESGRC